MDILNTHSLFNIGTTPTTVKIRGILGHYRGSFY